MRRHFAHLRRSWDATASIINAFTTFLLLAFSKILFVSFTLLYTFSFRPNYVDIPSKCVLYYDSTVECHTHEYTMFSALAGCALVIFIICPTILLILYPTRLFRRCVDFGGGMLCTCLLNHFRDSTRMEPMVLMTSGWFLHHSSSSGYQHCSCS